MQVRTRRGLTAAAMSVLLLACTLLAGWHEATVRHARCADHGELVEVGAGALARGDHQITAADGATDPQHEHCSLCPRTHDGTPPAIVQVRVPVRAVEPQPPQALLQIVRVARGTLHVAPKTSPPDRSASVS